MITLLFWNLGLRDENAQNYKMRQTNLMQAISNIVNDHQVDILLFAEFSPKNKYGANHVRLLQHLAKVNTGDYQYVDNKFLPNARRNAVKEAKTLENRKVQVFTHIDQDKFSAVNSDSLNITDTRRNSNETSKTPMISPTLLNITGDRRNSDATGIIPIHNALLEGLPLSDALFYNGEFDHSRLTLHRLFLNVNTELLLAAVHLIPKSYYNPSSQREEARRFSQRIRFTEQYIVKHTRTIVVGDFNMSPTEEGMTLADTFHSIAQENMPKSKPTRGVQDFEYPFLINKMWSHPNSLHFPGGTYVFDKTGQHTLSNKWYMHDQVLVRQDVLPYWHEGGLQILTRVGDRSLLNDKSEPDAKNFSDHLPILFRLQEEAAN